MAIVTYQQVSVFIPATLRTVVEPKFAEYEEQAAIHLRELAGVELPETPAEAPDWVIVPMAGLIAKLAITEFTKPNPEIIEQVNGDYDRVVKFLSRRSFRRVPTRTGAGQFDGEVRL